MKKLKVTWYAGSWSKDEEDKLAYAELPEKTEVRAIGNDALVFLARENSQDAARVHLVLSSSRLISATLVEVETDA
jgi:hypothetical protein